MTPLARRSLVFLTGLVLVALAMLGLAGHAYALATEHFGNAPVGSGWGFGPELLAAINVPARVYWYEVNGNPTCYFRGSAADLNEALRKFVAIPAERREVLLVAGPGETWSLTGDRRVAYDWCLHVPLGLRFTRDPEVGDTRAILTVQVTALRPAALPAPEQVRHWLADLDSSDFEARERASQALGRLGRAAEPSLRAALEGRPSAEVRRRVERLLERLEGTGLDQLELPARVPVVDLADLLGRCRRGLESADPQARGRAAIGLADPRAEAGEVLPALLDLLRDERHEYVRRCLASGLVRLGRRALPALPALREQVQDPDKNVQHSFQRAIELIEAAPAAPVTEEQAARCRALRAEIAAFCWERANPGAW